MIKNKVMNIIISIPYICICIYSLRKEYKLHFITPLFVFLLMQLIMYIGIMIRCNNNNMNHVLLLILYFIALVGLIVGAHINAGYLQGTDASDLNADISTNQFIKILFWSIVCIIICYRFFNNVGFNAFTELIAGGVDTDISELRRTINYTSGSGVVYQFRVFILPVLMIMLISSKNRRFRLCGLVLSPISILYLLGSGQRGGLASVMLMYIVVFLYRCRISNRGEIEISTYRGFKESNGLFFTFLVLSIIAFAALTIGNRRIDASGSLLHAITKRVFVDNQGCALYGFDLLVCNEEITYGYDWLMMTLNMVPGVRTGYTSVASRIFAMNYGSLRGTSPLCIWGSTYYNFGVIGVIILSFIIGYFYSYLGRKMNQKVFSTVELVLYSELVIILGTWIADGPYTLINNGGLALLLLYWSLMKSPLKFSFG